MPIETKATSIEVDLTDGYCCLSVFWKDPATAVIAVGLVLAVLAVLGSCAPDPLELAYKARVAEAAQHCRANGGDEFKPYGANAWLAMFSVGGSRPATFRCQRLEKHWKRGIAVYALRREGDTITMEIR